FRNHHDDRNAFVLEHLAQIALRLLDPSPVFMDTYPGDVNMLRCVMVNGAFFDHLLKAFDYFDVIFEFEPFRIENRHRMVWFRDFLGSLCHWPSRASFRQVAPENRIDERAFSYACLAGDDNIDLSGRFY